MSRFPTIANCDDVVVDVDVPRPTIILPSPSPAHPHVIVCVYAAVPLAGHCSFIVESFMLPRIGSQSNKHRHCSFDCAMCSILASGDNTTGFQLVRGTSDAVTAGSNAPAEEEVSNEYRESSCSCRVCHGLLVRASTAPLELSSSTSPAKCPRFSYQSEEENDRA
jgi:hypothetical protein